MSGVCRCSAGRILGEKKVVVPWKKLQKLLLGRELAQKKILKQLWDSEADP